MTFNGIQQQQKRPERAHSDLDYNSDHSEIDGGPRKATLHHHFTDNTFSGIVEIRSVLWLKKQRPTGETI